MKDVRIGCSGWQYDSWRTGLYPERPFQADAATAEWRVIRFHYGHRGRRGNYSGGELTEWAERIAGWRRTHAVWAYFNNDWEGFAPANAETPRGLLARGSVQESEMVASSTGIPNGGACRHRYP